MRNLLLILVFGLLFICGNYSCNQPTKFNSGDFDLTFQEDVNFLQQHEDIILLEHDSAKVLIVPSYQGRVMTSTSEGMTGESYGWINYDLIESGKYVPHFNSYGGEERFWMGPEGGQFSLFFKKGDPFDLEHWQTPGIIDTTSFDVLNIEKDKASFQKIFSISNYSGTEFNVKVNREIKMLNRTDVEEELEMDVSRLSWVAFQTTNSIQNIGDKDWSYETGVLSVWLLNMMKASPECQVIIPYKKGGSAQVNDMYFGKIPAERLQKKDSVLFFKADSKQRGKIGIPSSIVKPILGSYDAQRNVLTIVTFDYTGETKYVNSMWEIQEHPYKGDVVNAYNDGGGAEDGKSETFYELETSSPAVALKKNQTLIHVQKVFHFEGEKEELEKISLHLLNVNI